MKFLLLYALALWIGVLVFCAVLAPFPFSLFFVLILPIGAGMFILVLRDG